MTKARMKVKEKKKKNQSNSYVLLLLRGYAKLDGINAEVLSKI